MESVTSLLMSPYLPPLGFCICQSLSTNEVVSAAVIGVIKIGMGKKVSRQVLTYFNFECCIFRMQRHARDAGKDVWREKDISLAGLHRMCFCILLRYFSVVFLGKRALMVKQFPWNEFLQSGMSGTWWQSEADSTYLDVSVGQLAWECVEACRSAWWVCVWH